MTPSSPQRLFGKSENLPLLYTTVHDYDQLCVSWKEATLGNLNFSDPARHNQMLTSVGSFGGVDLS